MVSGLFLLFKATFALPEVPTTNVHRALVGLTLDLTIPVKGIATLVLGWLLQSILQPEHFHRHTIFFGLVIIIVSVLLHSDNTY